MPFMVAMLTGYYLLKNSSGDINLSFEFVSMAAAQTMECSFAVGQWTPLPRCLYGFLGWILKHPFFIIKNTTGNIILTYAESRALGLHIRVVYNENMKHTF